MSDIVLGKKVHTLHNKVGDLNAQMQSLVGAPITPGDRGRVGRLEKATDALAISQGKLGDEVEAMIVTQKLSNQKLAMLMLALAAIGSMAGTVVIKVLLG